MNIEDKYLNETRKKWYYSDKDNKRIGLVHYVPRGDKTVYVDDDVSDEQKKKIIEEFEKLEEEVYDFISIKSKEFESFLKKNNFESSMGSIDYIQKK